MTAETIERLDSWSGDRWPEDTWSVKFVNFYEQSSIYCLGHVGLPNSMSGCVTNWQLNLNILNFLPCHSWRVATIIIPSFPLWLSLLSKKFPECVCSICLSLTIWSSAVTSRALHLNRFVHSTSPCYSASLVLFFFQMIIISKYERRFTFWGYIHALM